MVIEIFPNYAKYKITFGIIPNSRSDLFLYIFLKFIGKLSTGNMLARFLWLALHYDFLEYFQTFFSRILLNLTWLSYMFFTIFSGS